MVFKTWNIGAVDKEAAKELSLMCDADPMVSLIAMSRGIDTPEMLDEFLSDDVILPDPFSMAGMDSAARRIRLALDRGESITVFGDYDCDGVTATAILYRYLRSKGANVDYYIPSREGEGYGMSASAVETLAAGGTNLIITVDNGIRAGKEIELAKSLGIDTVVTDHHIPADEIPEAIAVVDPHLPYCPSGLTELSGAGVALMLTAAVEDVTAEEMLEEYAALAALGTVADVVPLLGANRVIVREGLAAINAGKEPSLNELLICAAGKLPVSAENLAFILAPRINAAGRMDDAAKALQLLIGEEENLSDLAQQLCSLNADRRNIEQQILAEAVKAAEENGYCYDRVIVVSGEGWHCGIVGIVASCIAERYGRPAIVLSGEGGIYTGSGRSIEGFDLVGSLSCCEDLFEKFGGHSGAAGLTIKEENLEEFRRRINEYARGTHMPVPQLNIDCKLNPAAVNVNLAQRLQQLEPFGAGNPVPLFGLYGMKIIKIDFVGEGKHTRLTVAKNEVAISCMLFGVGKDDLPYETGDNVDLAVNISVSYFRGNPSVSVAARGIRPAGCDGGLLAQGLRIYEDYKLKLISGSTLADIIPNREEIGGVWRIIKARAGICKERLLCDSSLCPSKTALALDVLSELELISEISGRYYINPSAKADLGNSNILRSAQVMV